MKEPIKDYLGDSVYCSFDGFAFKLYLDNGAGEHTTIYLEQEVLAALDKFRERIKSIAAEKGQA